MQYFDLILLGATAAFAQSVISVISSSSDDSSATVTRTIGTTISSRASAATASTILPSNSDSNRITQSVYGLDNTVNIYEASVLAADQASTTYVASCATGRLLCVNDDFTMTSAASSIRLANTGISLGITYTELLTCQIEGTTSAQCAYSLGVETGGSSTSTVVTASNTGSTLPYATFVVTAGQEKLAAASTIPPSDTGNAASRATLVSSTANMGLLMAMLVSAGASLAFAVLL